MEITIRTVRETDAQSIIELLNPLIHAGTYTIMDQPLTIEEQRNFIHTFPKRGIFNIALSENDQKIQGLQSIEPLAPSINALKHVAEISTFVAHTAHRNGIGRRLSHATLQAAKTQGYLKIRATVRADNPQAIAFYRSQGFTIIGTAQKHALIQGTYIDEILMEKLIDEPPS